MELLNVTGTAAGFVSPVEREASDAVDTLLLVTTSTNSKNIEAVGTTMTFTDFGLGLGFKVGGLVLVASVSGGAITDYMVLRTKAYDPLGVETINYVGVVEHKVGTGTAITSWVVKWFGHPAVGIPLGQSSGFILTANVTDPSNDVDIGVGTIKANTGTTELITIASMTKRFDATWVKGTGNGGLFFSPNLTGVITTGGVLNLTGTSTTYLVDLTLNDTVTTAGGQCRMMRFITDDDTAGVQSPNWDSSETSVTYQRGGKGKGVLLPIYAIRQDSTGDIDFGAGNIADRPTGWTLYSNIPVGYLATGITTAIVKLSQNLNVQQFDLNSSSVIWRKPSNVGANSRVRVQCWGGGGAGARSTATTNGGGGGGAYVEKWFFLSQLNATMDVTVGGGAVGTAITASGGNGGSSAFDPSALVQVVQAYGGAGGTSTTGGGGGGPDGLPSGSTSGNPQILNRMDNALASQQFQGEGGRNLAGIQPGGNGFWHGGGGGESATGTGGDSIWGGAGGGGNGTAAGAVGGRSVNGGAGGDGAANGVDAGNGVQPGGGGGGSEAVATGVSGSGGAGRVIVTVYP